MVALGTAITGRCYCGALTISTQSQPQIVAYCHCSDCRRVSGAPVSAFAAFAPEDLNIMPDWPAPRSHTLGVDRWFCPDCGSPIAARYDYLPDQIYVPIGLLDQADQFPPEMHSHAQAALPWLHLVDDLPRNSESARTDLSAAKTNN